MRDIQINKSDRSLGVGECK